MHFVRSTIRFRNNFCVSGYRLFHMFFSPQQRKICRKHGKVPIFSCATVSVILCRSYVSYAESCADFNSAIGFWRKKYALYDFIYFTYKYPECCRYPEIVKPWTACILAPYPKFGHFLVYVCVYFSEWYLLIAHACENYLQKYTCVLEKIL